MAQTTRDLQNSPISSALADVQLRISRACARAGRAGDAVDIIAITKTFPVEVASKACALGIRHIGESRVQEAIEKFGDGRFLRDNPGTELHLVGHLQSNKAAKAVKLFTSIDALDSLEIAAVVSKEAVKNDKRIRVLFEVNTSGETQKFGFRPDLVVQAVETALSLPNLEVAGLMTIGPNVSDRVAIRRSFASLRTRFEEIKFSLKPPHWKVISMGMSADYEIAVEEGATEVRLGTVLFGEREQT